MRLIEAFRIREDDLRQAGSQQSSGGTEVGHGAITKFPAMPAAAYVTVRFGDPEDMEAACTMASKAKISYTPNGSSSTFSGLGKRKGDALLCTFVGPEEGLRKLLSDMSHSPTPNNEEHL